MSKDPSIEDGIKILQAAVDDLDQIALELNDGTNKAGILKEAERLRKVIQDLKGMTGEAKPSTWRFPSCFPEQ